MYKTLNAEIARVGWDKRILSNVTGIKYQTLVTKMQGKSPFKLDECIVIKNALGVNTPLEELFLRD